MRYPKFEEKLKQQVLNPTLQQNYGPGDGMILSYNPVHNTATVLMSQPGSDEIGRIERDVICPSVMGVQAVSPKMGDACAVQYYDGTKTKPFITHFYNDFYEQSDYRRQFIAENDVPRFMMEM